MAKETPPPLQQTLKGLERAYTHCLAKRAAFPRFKKRGQRDSFHYPEPQQIRRRAIASIIANIR